MKLGALIRVVFSTLLLLSSGSVIAQQNKKVTNTEDQYGDWSVRCSQVGSEQKRCVMQQQALITETGQRLMQVNIIKNKKQKFAIMTFTLPLGTFLPTGAQLYFDDLKEANLRIDFCDQRGCFVNLPLNSEFEKKLKKLKTGSIVIVSASDKSKPIKIPFSGKGFTKAFANLR